MNKKHTCQMNCMHNMPMHNMPCQMHIMENTDLEMVYFEEDEKDENYYMELFPEHCMKMQHHIDNVLDNMEEKNDALYEKYLDKETIKKMTDDAYADIAKEMPELEEEHEKLRQYGFRPIARDLIGVLLLNELLRRRRRRRRFHRPPHYGYGGYNYGGYGSPFDFNDYYYDYD